MEEIMEDMGGEAGDGLTEGVDGVAGDLESGLDQAEMDAQSGISDEIADIEEMSSTPQDVEPTVQAEVDTAMTEPGVTEAVEVEPTESEALNPKAEEVPEDAPKAKTTNYVKNALKNFGPYFKEAGKAIFEGVATYYKYQFYMDMAKTGTKDLTTIIEACEGVKPPPGIDSKRLKTYLSFVKAASAMVTMVRKLDTTCKNTSLFPGTADPKQIGYQVKNVLDQNESQEIPNKCIAVTKSGAALVLSVAKALRALGVTGSPDEASVKKSLENVSSMSPTDFTNAMNIVKIEDVETFITSVQAFDDYYKKDVRPKAEKMVNLVLDSPLDPNTNKPLLDELDAFFRLPQGLNAALTTMKSTLTTKA